MIGFIARIKEFAIWLKERWLAVLVVSSVITIGCLGYSNYIINQDRSLLEKDLSRVESQAEQDINSLRQNLSQIKFERDSFEKSYNDEKKRMEDFVLQISSIKDTIGIIEKLKNTDPELLKKYSKIYFLNENYVPQNLVKIDPKYVYNPKKDLFFLNEVLPYLQKMMDDAYATGIDIKILSAYRSFGEQTELKSSYVVVYGSDANKFSADQGYSEHQLGTALDFTTSKLGELLLSESFEKTPAYQWLTENAYKYGFILSYSKSNGYYEYEPWHWRFIGRDFATKLREDNKIFYDLDQRLIDTYLISFFD